MKVKSSSAFMAAPRAIHACCSADAAHQLEAVVTHSLDRDVAEGPVMGVEVSVDDSRHFVPAGDGEPVGDGIDGQCEHHR